MVRVFIAFFLLLTAVFLGIQLNYDPGYVLISINHWKIETTVWFGVFALLFIFTFMHLFLQLLHKIAKTPGKISRWQARRRAQKAQDTTRQGLIEYSEGYWQKAKNHLIQALPNTDTPLLNYLTAARAAQKMGDSTLRDHYLREAQQSMPEAKIAVELTQAQLQLANHQWEQALATLRHLQDLAPHHPYVLKLLMHLYQEVRDWPQLIAMLPQLRKYTVISAEEFVDVQKNAYIQAMKDLAKQNQTEALQILFNSIPKTLIHDEDIIAEFTQYLIRHNDYVQAENILRRVLKKEFSTQLVELYGLLPSNESQLIFAESLLKKNPHSAALFLCLGRQCLHQHLWGKARSYLEQSLEIKPRPVTYIELAKLHERLNDAHLASYNFKKGLELATQLDIK